MRKTLLLLIPVIVALGVGAGLTFGNANGDYYTGCLDLGGNLIKIAAGNEPLRACSDEEQQITLASAAMEANGLAIAQFYDV